MRPRMAALMWTATSMTAVSAVTSSRVREPASRSETGDASLKDRSREVSEGATATHMIMLVIGVARGSDVA